MQYLLYPNMSLTKKNLCCDDQISILFHKRTS